jgi:glycosyltransferase involved in cell wall biosynthesis
MSLIVDCTHLCGAITGIERITLNLFSPQALAPLDVTQISAASVSDMIIRQNLTLPLMINQNSENVLICPGYPPATALFPFRKRVIPYIHDTFLLSRWADLNIRAKLYMALPFRLAVSTYPQFLVNSETTYAALRKYCRTNAKVLLYRPEVSNTFGVKSVGRAERCETLKNLKIFTIGTVEPRKNYRAAAHIVAALREKGLDASIEIAGRKGWGDDWTFLQSAPDVTLLGYATPAEINAAFERADIFLCTSHDEGLGLPLLEAQHAGLPIFVPDSPIFHEVLGESGFYIDPANPQKSAELILQTVQQSGWRHRSIFQADRNLVRWNAHARKDRSLITAFLAGKSGTRNDLC